MTAVPAVNFERVTYAYPGASQPALRDITLRVEEGERLGILGPNGGGKSTLLKIALGLLPGYTGRVEVRGLAPERARRDGLVGYVAQRCEAALAFPLSARQVVEMGASVHSPTWRGVGRAARTRVDRCLDLVGAREFASAPIGDLSGGQLQRTLIARALAAEPAILALDEPTVGIDAVGQRRFADLLATVHRELKLTILIVSHDVRVVAAGCDRVACLARTLHFHASPRGLTVQVLAEVFRHDVSSVFGDLHVDAHAAGECSAHHDHNHHHDHADHAGAHAPASESGPK